VSDHLLLAVLAMGAVTYLPRMLPFVLLKEMRLPPRVNSFLRYIPVAALGALVFPGVLDSTGSAASALAGCLASVALALARANILLVVIGGIAGVVAWEYFI